MENQILLWTHSRLEFYKSFFNKLYIFFYIFATFVIIIIGIEYNFILTCYIDFGANYVQFLNFWCFLPM